MHHYVVQINLLTNHNVSLLAALDSVPATAEAGDVPLSTSQPPSEGQGPGPELATQEATPTPVADQPNPQTADEPGMSDDPCG